MSSDIKKRIMEAAQKFNLTEYEIEPLGKVWLRPAPLATITAMNKEGLGETEKGLIVIMDCVCDEDGNPVFGKNDKDWVDNRIPTDVAAKVANKVMEISGYDESEQEVMGKSSETA